MVAGETFLEFGESKYLSQGPGNALTLLDITSCELEATEVEAKKISKLFTKYHCGKLSGLLGFERRRKI